MRKPKPKLTLLCYHCGEPANGGGDHVPPRSFFPPGKNPDLRVQLMKVPACAKHNQQKSLDDDYVRMVISGISHNVNTDKRLQYLVQHTVNLMAQKQTLMSLVLRDPKTEIKEGQSFTSGEIDVERILFFMEAVARGVLHYDRHMRWDGEVKVLPHFLVDEGASAELKKASKALLQPGAGGGIKGRNQPVFYYEIEDFSSIASSSTFVVHMCFYGDTKVSVIFLNGVEVPQPQPY